MERRVINPWKWQDQFGFAQANEAAGFSRMVVFAGQAAISAEGAPMHAGDMGAQVKLALDNLETVMKEAGVEWSNIIRLNYYTTDVDLLFTEYEAIVSRLAKEGCRPASTLLGIQRLAFPELLIEIEATAVV